MNRVLKTIVGAAPGAVFGWAQALTKIFEGTAVFRVHASESLPYTAAALATVVTIVVSAIFANAPWAILLVLCVACMLAGAYCFNELRDMKIAIHQNVSADVANAIAHRYDLFTIIFLIVVALAITFAVLFSLNAVHGPPPPGDHEGNRPSK